jgi:2-polyprenyl-3-methyl-5-hydroxy-6-metoxy-1,4-benzoquinol methylase
MANALHVSRALARVDRPEDKTVRIADLGAGDGRFMLCVARRMRRPGIEVHLVDRADGLGETVEAFARLQWKAIPATAEVHDFLERPGPRFDAIVANLFLHHFDAASLRRLLELVAQRTALFVACEPRRSRLALQASRLLRLMGCNDVTRHDAVASVRAGFGGREVSGLWPDQDHWQLEERPARPLGHFFSARHAAL